MGPGFSRLLLWLTIRRTVLEWLRLLPFHGSAKGRVAGFVHFIHLAGRSPVEASPAVPALVVPHRVSGDPVEPARAVIPDEMLPDMYTESPGGCS